MGQAPAVLVDEEEELKIPEWDRGAQVVVLTQTTLSVADTARAVQKIQDRFPSFGLLVISVVKLGDRNGAQTASCVDEWTDNASRAFARHQGFPRHTRHGRPTPGRRTALDAVIAALNCHPH